MLAGLVYSDTGRIASAYRANAEWARRQHQRELAELSEILPEFVHADNIGALPPSPFRLAYKAQQIGLIQSASKLVVEAGYLR